MQKLKGYVEEMIRRVEDLNIKYVGGYPAEALDTKYVGGCGTIVTTMLLPRKSKQNLPSFVLGIDVPLIFYLLI